MHADSSGPRRWRSRLSLFRFLILALPIVLGMPRLSISQDEAKTLSNSFRAAAKRVLPSVVTVRATLSPSAAPLDALRPGPGSRDPGGSGVLIDVEQGYVLTNAHVVNEGLRKSGPLLVLLPDGQSRTVLDVRQDPLSDLALLLIDPNDLPDTLASAVWGDSETLEIGDWVLAVGQPFGLSGTVTAGIISGKGRNVGVTLYEDLLQTDAAINPGNSGGPLVNLEGEVVGINVAIKTIHGGHEGVGFAVPSRRARRVAADLAEHGKVRRVYLGLGIDGATRQGTGPVIISSVATGTPAERAGLRPGDQIVQLDGQAIEGAGMLTSAVEFAPAGEPLLLTIERDGQDFEVEVRPDPQPETFGLPGSPSLPFSIPLPSSIRAPFPERSGASETEGVSQQTDPAITLEPAKLESGSPSSLDPDPSRPKPGPARFQKLGLVLEPASASLANRFGFAANQKGLVVLEVEPESPADLGGLEPGMLITHALDHPLPDLESLRDRLTDRPKDSTFLLRIQKGDKTEFRVLLD